MRAWAAVSAMCIFLVCVIFLTPYLSSRGFGQAADLGFSAFAAVCHQIPERSLSLWGARLPVCSRCLGIYVGMLLGSLAYPLMPKSGIPFGLAVLLAAPMAVDVLGQAAGFWVGANVVRLATGLLVGPAVTMTVIGALDGPMGVFIRPRR